MKQVSGFAAQRSRKRPAGDRRAPERPRDSSRESLITARPRTMSPNSRQNRRATQPPSVGKSNTGQRKVVPLSSHPQGRITRMSASKKQTSAAHLATNTVAPPVAHFVGIDVAKDSYVVHVAPLNQSRTFKQTAAGFAATIAWLQPLNVQRIVLEATGGYESDLAWALLEAVLPVSIINPHQSHYTAKALAKRDKSDRSDAEVLAWMGEHMQLRLAEKPAQKQLEMQELVTRRRQLVQMRTAEKNRRQHVRNKEALSSIQKHLDLLKKEIHRIETAIAKLIQADDDWKQTAQLLESTTGVKHVVSHTLIAELPELGRVNRQEITALAGLAPRLRESGKWQGERRISGGRGTVRSILYMATLSALRSNPVIKKFYQHLLKLGKKKKVALTACMRKLLIVLNTMLKTKTAWRDVTALTQPITTTS